MVIRKADTKDLERINEIFNQAILDKFQVADLTQWTIEKRQQWFDERNHEEYPIYVAEIDDIVVGYANINPYRPGRMAVRQTAEISCFIDKNCRASGIGKTLMNFLEPESAKIGIKTLFAIIIDNNDASIKLVEKLGYEKWGHMPNVAVFENVEAGHVYYGKRIKK
ncbi:MAG: N-acetyltransferase family protein [Bacteroidales bacterium]|nr:N-acetyltransferase family protein [Bacteroidales bacterium]